MFPFKIGAPSPPVHSTFLHFFNSQIRNRWYVWQLLVACLYSISFLWKIPHCIMNWVCSLRNFEIRLSGPITHNDSMFSEHRPSPWLVGILQNTLSQVQLVMQWDAAWLLLYSIHTWVCRPLLLKPGYIAQLIAHTRIFSISAIV